MKVRKIIDNYIHTGEANCDAGQSVAFFEKVPEAYPKSPFIVLCLDNAPYFRAAEVSEWLGKHPRIILPLSASVRAKPESDRKAVAFCKKAHGRKQIL